MRDDKPDRFVDDLLEASLERYRGEEPRTGLEMRILAGVRTRERAARRRWLGRAAAVCAGIMAIVALTLHFVRAPVRQPTPRASLPQSPAEAPAMVSQQQPGLRPRGSGSARPEQFPTPLPFTEQEKLLLAYVSKATQADLAERANKTDEAPIPDLEIPRIKIAALEIKPLDDSQSEQGK